MAEGAVSTKTQAAPRKKTSGIVSHLVLRAASHTQPSAGCYNLDCETQRECGYMVD